MKRSINALGFVSSRLLFGLMAAAVSLAGVARADVIRLENNDLLHGEVTGADATNLKFKHVHAGEMTIPWKNVVYVQTDKPVDLKLTDGSVLKSKLGIGDEPRTLKADLAGSKEPSRISLDKIAAVNEPPEAAVWSGRIALGITIQDGNTDTKSIFGSFDAERKTKQDRIEAHALYNYGETDNELSARNSFVRIQYSYYILNPLYLYVGGALEYDWFKDIDLRSRGGGGLGYDFFAKPELVLRAEAGAEYVNVNYHSIPDDEYVALRFAGQFEWQIIDSVRFSEVAEILPNTERFKHFISRSNTTVTVKLIAGLGIAASVIWVHDSEPSAGFGRNDTTYCLTATYSF